MAAGHLKSLKGLMTSAVTDAAPLLAHVNCVLYRSRVDDEVDIILLLDSAIMNPCASRKFLCGLVQGWTWL